MSEKMERRRQPASEIYIVVLFTDEITNEEMDFLNSLRRAHRVFIVTSASDAKWENELQTATGYKADRINMENMKEMTPSMRNESIADVVHILTMRGRPKRYVYLHPGPNVEKWNLNLEEVKETLEKDKDTEVQIK